MHVSLDEAAVVGGNRPADLVALDDAMNALARFDPRKVQVVEMRFFGGLSVEETAEVLKISPVTVRRDWSTAKAWLYREIPAGASRLAGALMDSERWKQIDSLLHAALERPPEEREAFLRHGVRGRRGTGAGSPVAAGLRAAGRKFPGAAGGGFGWSSTNPQ